MHITCYLGVCTLRVTWVKADFYCKPQHSRFRWDYKAGLLQKAGFGLKTTCQSWPWGLFTSLKNHLITVGVLWYSVTGNWTDGGQISKATQCCTNMVQQRRPGEMNPQRTPEYFHHLPHLLFHKHSLPQPNILSLHPFLFFLNKNVSKLSLSTIVFVNLSSPNLLKRIVATIIFLGCKESTIIKPCSWPEWVFSVF